MNTTETPPAEAFFNRRRRLEYPDNVFGKLCDESNYGDIICEAPLPLGAYQHEITVDDWELTLTQRSVICTNAAIEKYLQYRHDPKNPSTHLWNRFDIIVWDEVHSLGIDSTYQSSPYHVMQLFKQTYQKMRLRSSGKLDPANGIPYCKNLIMMTATPEPLQSIALPKDTHFIDLRKICRSVYPRNIHFLSRQQAEIHIRQQLHNGERIVYFANHVPSVEILSNTYGISNERIAILFSDRKRRKELEDKFKANKAAHDSDKENDYTRMVNVEEHLAIHASIRADIDLFVTTSRNKEGIDINDKDIQHVYVESHSRTDIHQMAGRIRSGAEHLYIIIDSEGYGNTEHRYERVLAEYLCDSKQAHDSSSHANSLLKKFCDEHELSINDAYRTENHDLDDFIDLIKQKFPYVEFDYFAHKFCFNSYRELSKEFISAETRSFSEASQVPQDLVALFQRAFPYSDICSPIPPEEEAQQIGWDFLNSHPTGKLTEEELDDLIANLDVLLTTPQNRRRRKSHKPAPNRLLHQIGLDYSPRNNNTHSEGYSEHILRPWKKSSKAA